MNSRKQLSDSDEDDIVSGNDRRTAKNTTNLSSRLPPIHGNQKKDTKRNLNETYSEESDEDIGKKKNFQNDSGKENSSIRF